MSGIAGILNPGGRSAVETMLERIGHRGPDGRSVASAEAGVFGAVRLRLGPSDEAGPLAGRGRLIVWDGELYEFESLKAESGSSAETDLGWILEQYSREGPACLTRLNAPFALALLDGDDLVLARDRFGQAPLYYGMVEGRLCFASEIKAFHDVASEIRAFPPGHILQGGKIKPLPFPAEAVPMSADPSAIAAGLLERLERSVRRRLARAPRLGVWLSGGLDSSVLASLAAAASPSVETFSAGVAGAPDLAFAKEVASFLGTAHHERLCSVEDMLRVLPRVIYHLESFDAPLVRSAVANHLVAEAAAGRVRAVLSGEGADELFAGYSFLKNRDEASLRAGLAEAQAALHNTALQRVDRSAAAFGTRARPAYLDLGVAAFAAAVPGACKVHGPEQTEKWILRKAIEGRLPDGVVWRPKEKFWSGSGIANRLADLADERIGDAAFAAEREVRPGFVLDSKEDLMYWRIFRGWFPRADVLDSLGRTVHRETR